MADKSAAALREIASQLKKQVAQREKEAKKADKRMAKFKIPKIDKPDFDFPAMEAKQEVQRAEDVAWRERLVKTIERHNDLLSQLLERKDR